MQRLDILHKRRDRIKEDILSHLDGFLIGTVARSPSMRGHGLTTKVDQKTVSVYVRKDLVTKAQEMCTRYKKLWTLIQKLSKINWEILKAEHE